MRPEIAAIAFAAVLAAGCASDHRGRVAQAMLFDHSGRLDEAAFSAVLRDRMSKSLAPSIALVSLVRSAEGTCASTMAETTECEIPVSAEFCGMSSIRIAATVSGGSVVNLKVKHWYDGC
jgi:hypothetical protein